MTPKDWSPAPKVQEFESLFYRLLEVYGLEDESERDRFFTPSLEGLHDPDHMRGMDRACARIIEAIENKERIMVFGDFDADGITSTVILVHGLQQLGAQVSYRIPDREKDSHGLKEYLLDEIAQTGTQLVITCDCGVNDHAAVAHGASLGMDIIITDHHDADPAQFPKEAIAVLNPREQTCQYPEKNLAGAGVAFKVISALASQRLEADDIALFLPRYLEICAIGLIADCMKIQGENRVLVKYGLEMMKQTHWEGLALLLEKEGVVPESIDAQTVGFTIAPKLNAASRMGDVTKAVQLFLGDPLQHDARLTYLHNLNQSRKEAVDLAMSQLGNQVIEGKASQFLSHPEWRPGILGLVASKIVEKTGVPTTVCQEQPEGKLACSCRAPQGYSMIAGLRAVEDDLLYGFGGHKGAAGLKAQTKDKDLIATQIEGFFAAQNITTPALEVAAFITPELLGEPLLNLLEKFSPFGVGNPAPLFGLQNLKILSVDSMGKDRQHLRISGETEGEIVNLVAFFKPDWLMVLKAGDAIDVLFAVSANYWKGEKKLQLKAMDIRKV